MSILTHASAAELHAKARDAGRGKPVDNNTYVVRRGEDYAVRFHETDIVTIHPDDSCTLATGGWYSKTTAERINAYSPAVIVTRKGRWYISRRAQRFYPGPLRYARSVGWRERQPVTAENRAYFAAVRAWEKKNLLAFSDGVRVDSKGRVVAPATLPKGEAPEVVTAAWDRSYGGWSGPVLMRENRQRHEARIAALMAGFRQPHPDDARISVITLPAEAIRACPHYIMLPEHYRADASCRCDDASHSEMSEWGYEWKDGAWR